MKTKEEIVNILLGDLCYVYCDNCAHKMTSSRCDECHRKYMNWELSESAAEEIADKIMG